MKNYLKIFIISFLITISTTLGLANPMGIYEKKIDFNLECIDEKEPGRKQKFGLKEYTYKSNNKKILLKLPFSKKYKDYGYPESEVYDLGPYDLKGVKYDNLKMMFDHVSTSDGKHYLGRQALFKEGDNYWLNDSFFKSSKKLNNKLYELQDQIDELIKKKKYDSVADGVKNYTSIIFDEIKKNAKETLLTTIVYKCTLN